MDKTEDIMQKQMVETIMYLKQMIIESLQECKKNSCIKCEIRSKKTW